MKWDRYAYPDSDAMKMSLSEGHAAYWVNRLKGRANLRKSWMEGGDKIFRKREVRGFKKQKNISGQMWKQAWFCKK